jgi:endoglucanase
VGRCGDISSGTLDNMILCPANGVDTFKKFNGSDGVFDASQVAVYQNNVQSSPPLNRQSTSPQPLS